MIRHLSITTCFTEDKKPIPQVPSKLTICLRPLFAAPGSFVGATSPSQAVAVVAAAPLNEDGDGLFKGVQSVLVGVRLSVNMWTPSEGGCRAYAEP